MEASNLTNLSIKFIEFADRECKVRSPLYHQLSHGISQDKELLALASHARERQPVPNLFLAAIHYVLLQSQGEELASYYPSISKKASAHIPFDLFKAFCSQHEAEIIDILQNRIVQTNAINRTAYLMPVFSSLCKNGEPVTLVDIGTSSGLTLQLDQYEYHYTPGESFGKSKVIIRSDILSGAIPVFEEILQVKRKIGIDQNPLDLTISDNALWLKALIWPDMQERFARMEAAIEIALNAPVEMYKASQINEFKAIIDQIPQHESLIIYHTHALYQFKKRERAAFRNMLDDLAKDRDFTYVAAEANIVFDREDYVEKGSYVEVNEYINGSKHTQVLALTNGHGTWIKWK